MRKYILLIISFFLIQGINAQQSFDDSFELYKRDSTKFEQRIIYGDTLFINIPNPIISAPLFLDDIPEVKSLPVNSKSQRMILDIPIPVAIDKNKDIGSIGAESQIVNGALVYTVPIEIMPSSTGFQPSLSISYNSMGGNGIAGFGWNIGGLSEISITNSTYYHNSGKVRSANRNGTSFVLDGIQLIVTDTTFSDRIVYQTEQGNIKIVYYSPSGKHYFEVFYPDGRKAIYGYKTNSTAKISYPLTEITDMYRNYINYSYTEVNNVNVVSEIDYGIDSSKKIGSIKFYYKDRSDIRNLYVDDVSVKQQKLLTKVEVFAETALLKTYGLEHDLNEYNFLSQITCKADNKEFNPLLFYYGDSKTQEKKLEYTSYAGGLLNNYFPTSGLPDELVVHKARLSNINDKESLIVYPYRQIFGVNKIKSISFLGVKNPISYGYGSMYAPDQELLIYTDLSSINISAKKILAGDGFMDLSGVDIDGNGKDELLKINYVFEKDFGKVTISQYDQELDLIRTNSFYLEGAFKSGSHRNPFPRSFIYGDFNGDGKIELLTIYGNKVPNDVESPREKSRATLIDLEKMSIVLDTMVPPIDILSGESIFAFDFDGDGKSEYCAIKEDGLYIYTFENNSFSQILHTKAVDSKQLAGDYEDYHKRSLLLGDINGDGKIDLLITPRYNDFVVKHTYYDCGKCKGCRESGNGGYEQTRAISACTNRTSTMEYVYNSTSKEWTVLYSTGKNIIKETFNFINIDTNYLSESRDQSYTKDVQLILQDINRDKLPDLIVKDNKAVFTYLNKNGKMDASKGDPSVSIPYNAYLIPTATSDTYNPSKRSQLLTIMDSIVNFIHFTFDEGKQQLLTKTADGLGNIGVYSYCNLSERKNYSTTIPGDTTVLKYPYNAFMDDLNVISSTAFFANQVKISNNDYSYAAAVVNRHGRGFCGFSKIWIYDYLRDITTVQTFDPEKFGVQIGADSPITSSTSTYSISIAANKIAKVLLASVTEKDKLNDNTITSSYTYDSYGNRIGEIVDYGNNIKVTTSNQYNNYTGTVYKLGELVSQEIKSERDSKSVKTKTLISYNTNYLPTSKKTYYDDKLTSEEAYYYNSKFQLDSLRTKAYSSPNWLSTKYTYDAYGRIATETDALGLKITNTYNTKGLLVSVKNHKGHETKYEYDPWGRKKKSIFPDGTTETTTLEWAKTDSELGTLDPNKNSGTLKINTSPPSGTITACESIILQPGFSYTSASGSLLLNIEPNICATVPTTSGVSTSYLITTIATGAPTTKVYYDALGREVRKGEVRFDGKYLYTDYIYNNKGKLQKASLPFKGSAPALWNEYSYDSYDRITSLAYASGKKDTYSYPKNKVTSLVDGISTTKTYNAAGELISVTDAAGTITYVLRPDGQPSSITAPGNVTTSFEYDAYGRQTKIIDPSAGTKTFAYDIAGNIAKETDANNKSINYTYDKYNRLIKKEIVGEQTISSVYNSDGLLTSETSTNNTSKTYTYDNLLRVSTQRETVVDGKWLEKQYAYSGGNTASTLYTSQSGTIATENYSYSYGHLSEMKLNNSTSIWKLTAENNLGMASQAITGGLTRTYGYNAYGLPSMRSTTNGGALIQVFTYEFDSKTGNLTWRKDNTRNLQENFTYDNLNRLVSFGGNTITYDVKGNITNHTGVGKFEYLRTDKPYAITDVTPYGNVIPLRNQKITYNAQMRPLSITENNYVATFAYNSGGDRVKMHIKKNNIDELIRYYIGAQYEIDGGVGGDKERLYLGGDAYSAAAVYVKEAGKWNIYYICRDYLGSITHIINATGVVKQELSYDAWGRLRNPVDQKLYAEGTEPVLLLGRGYTGHEHLQMFGLINMNARLYDPVIGRFLSPDPYVQAPDWSQNFNRYSYGWNNPLRYTDPNGEWVHLVIGAVVGGVINWGVNGFEFNLKGLGYFGAGAAAGLLTAAVGPLGAAAGGIIVGAANTALGGGTMQDILINAGIGGLSGWAGSVAGSAASSLFNNISVNGFAISKISSPLLKGAIQGAVGGGAGGYVGGFTAGLIMTGDLTEAHQAGWKGAKGGLTIGAITGAATAIRQAHLEGRNVVTGKRSGADIVGSNYNEVLPTQDWIDKNQVEYYKNQISKNELVKPIRAYEVNNKVYIEDGHHRYVAYKALGLKPVMSIVKTGGPIGYPSWSSTSYENTNW